MCEEGTFSFSYLVSELLDSALILANSFDCVCTSSLLGLHLSLELTHLCGTNTFRHLFEVVKSDVTNLVKQVESSIQSRRHNCLFLCNFTSGSQRAISILHLFILHLLMFATNNR